jgi:hypothetical protein
MKAAESAGTATSNRSSAAPRSLGSRPRVTRSHPATPSRAVRGMCDRPPGLSPPRDAPLQAGHCVITGAKRAGLPPRWAQFRFARVPFHAGTRRELVPRIHRPSRSRRGNRIPHFARSIITSWSAEFSGMVRPSPASVLLSPTVGMPFDKSIRSHWRPRISAAGQGASFSSGVYALPT